MPLLTGAVARGSAMGRPDTAVSRHSHFFTNLAWQHHPCLPGARHKARILGLLRQAGSWG